MLADSSIGRDRSICLGSSKTGREPDRHVLIHPSPNSCLSPEPVSIARLGVPSQGGPMPDMPIFVEY